MFPYILTSIKNVLVFLGSTWVFWKTSVIHSLFIIFTKIVLNYLKKKKNNFSLYEFKKVKHSHQTIEFR